MSEHPVYNSVHQVTISIGDKAFIKQMRLGENWQPGSMEAEGVITGFDNHSFTVLYDGQYRVFPFHAIGEFVRVVSDTQPSLKVKREEIQALYDFFGKHGRRYCKDLSDLAKVGNIHAHLYDVLFWIDKLLHEQGEEKL